MIETHELSKMMVSLNWSKEMFGLTLLRESSAQLKTILGLNSSFSYKVSEQKS